jgi:hypothetical protein
MVKSVLYLKKLLEILCSDNINQTLMRRSNFSDLLINGRRKMNCDVISSDVPLTRKQRRRLQRRLMSATKIENISSGLASQNLGDDNTSCDDREWTPVTRAGSIDRTTPPALETVTTLPNGRTIVTPNCFPTCFVRTSNAFDVLNHSLHDDPTPIKERSLNYRPNVDHSNPLSSVSVKKLKFSPEVVNINKAAADVNLLAVPKHLLANRAGLIKRSKSTSPTRSKNQTAKQRDIFKQFNPETADWIKH